MLNHLLYNIAIFKSLSTDYRLLCVAIAIHAVNLVVSMALWKWLYCHWALQLLWTLLKKAYQGIHGFESLLLPGCSVANKPQDLNFTVAHVMQNFNAQQHNINYKLLQRKSKVVQKKGGGGCPWPLGGSVIKWANRHSSKLWGFMTGSLKPQGDHILRFKWRCELQRHQVRAVFSIWLFLNAARWLKLVSR